MARKYQKISQLAKVSSRKASRKFLRHLKARKATLSHSCTYFAEGKSSGISPHLAAALDEFVYAWHHSDEYPHFTDTDKFMRYLETGEYD